MTNQYIRDNKGKGYIRRTFLSFKAPRPYQEPIQFGPNQNTGLSHLPDVIDFSQAGPTLDLVAKLYSKQTVKVIEIKQRSYIPSAPPVRCAPDPTQNQLFYAENYARETFPYGRYKAPPSYQSIPGYTVRSVQINKSSRFYPSKPLKAPKAKIGGAVCE
jgi:hypothetical protein